MRFQWRDATPPPKRLVKGEPVAIAADDMAAALRALPAPTPANLLDASKDEDHILHWELWHEGDQVWASRGRQERCRQIIGAVQDVTIVGGKEIVNRVVEFVRVRGEPTWAHMDQILSDPELDEAYLAEITRLQQQALDKMQRYRQLKSGK